MNECRRENIHYLMVAWSEKEDELNRRWNLSRRREESCYHFQREEKETGRRKEKKWKDDLVLDTESVSLLERLDQSKQY